MRLTSLWRPASVIAILLGSLLLWNGTPFVMSAAIRAQHHDVLREISRGTPQSFSKIASAIEDYKRAIRWRPDGRNMAELGYLYCAAATRMPRDRRDNFLSSCANWHQQALKYDPVQPYAAMQLAIVLTELYGYNATAEAALKHSLKMGQVLPRLVLPRVDMALKYWPIMDAETRELLTQQVRLAVEWEGRHLAARITTPGRERLVISLLHGDDALTEKFRSLQ